MLFIPTFDLQPGDGLGFINLFDSLYSVVNELNGRGLDQEIRFIYNADSPLIVVQLERYGLNLFFDSCKQRLLFIELNIKRDDTFQISYKGEIARLFEFKAIYNKIFGPTFPGNVETADGSTDYYLSYPGIAFKFGDICTPEVKEAVGKLAGGSVSCDDDGSIVQILSNSAKPIECTCITLFRGANWRSACREIARYLEHPTSESLFKLQECNDESAPSTSVNLPVVHGGSGIEIRSATADLTKHVLHMSFARHPKLDSFVVKIGETTMLDVVSCLGSPEDVVTKSRKSEGTSYALKIHNYFRLGLDFVYRLDHSNKAGNGTVVDRIVLHGNVVDSLEFMRYEKVPVKLKKVVSAADDSGLPSRKVVTCRGFSTFPKVKGLLGSPASQSQAKPIFLDRKEFEVNPDNINTDNVFELVDLDGGEAKAPPTKEVKAWGLSKLYSLDHTVFEVLIAGELVTSITMF